MKHVRQAVAVFALAFGICPAAERPPRIAVWDPEVRALEARSTLDPAHLDGVAAWQDGTLPAQVGARYVYDPARHDQGWNHASTPLLRRYLPNAPDLPATRLQGWWIVPWPQAGGAP